MESLETEIARWRAFVEQERSVNGRDIEELEDHLRAQIADLSSSGLAPDEAFLVAVKRMGSLDDLSREFAQEHSGRLWRQLVTSPDEELTETTNDWRLALGFAFAAAITAQIVRFVAQIPDEEPLWLLRNASLFVLSFLAGYFALRRGLSARKKWLTVAPFALAAIVINVYPYPELSSTELLVAAHLPVALWFVIAFPYMEGTLTSHEKRMDFVRFTGEWFIYYVLIALGGGVLMALTALILEPIGVDTLFIANWVLPSGATGAVIVAAWLVESKQRVVENMAPVLTMIFTPLFALMLVGTAVVYAFNGLGGDFDRELLGVFDALLVVVLGLVLYGISARDPASAPGWSDRVQLAAIVGAFLLDGMVLGEMIDRIGDLGFTPNRTAAIGLNLLLFVNLAGSAWISSRFLAGKGTLHRLERWQTRYLTMFAAWAALVVVVLPPLFGFE